MQSKAASEAARQEFSKLQSTNDKRANDLKAQIKELTEKVNQLSKGNSANASNKGSKNCNRNSNHPRHKASNHRSNNQRQ